MSKSPMRYWSVWQANSRVPVGVGTTITDRPPHRALPSLRRWLPPCSAGSQVLLHSPTSPTRACPPCGSWPSRTGLDRQTKACWRSPGSRACCFISVLGFSDYAGPDSHSRITRLPCCLPPTHHGVGILIPDFSKLNSPAHWYLCLRFTRHLTMSHARLEARMDSLFPFL